LFQFFESNALVAARLVEELLASLESAGRELGGATHGVYQPAQDDFQSGAAGILLVHIFKTEMGSWRIVWSPGSKGWKNFVQDFEQDAVDLLQPGGRVALGPLDGGIHEHICVGHGLLSTECTYVTFLPGTRRPTQMVKLTLTQGTRGPIRRAKWFSVPQGAMGSLG